MFKLNRTSALTLTLVSSKMYIMNQSILENTVKNLRIVFHCKTKIHFKYECITKYLTYRDWWFWP